MKCANLILLVAYVTIGCNVVSDKNDFIQLKWEEVEGGKFTFGNARGMLHEQPEVEILMKPFYLSRTEVTNAMFKNFVDATGYITEAEKNNKGGILFRNGWEVDSSATWKRPLGKDSSIDSLMHHPVVMVSYNDAVSYCKWVGGRLPSEMELEFAMKTVKNKQKKTNTWTGVFPVYNNARDGYKLTAPVNSSMTSNATFAHIAGNVWEWCMDSYNSNIHDKINAGETAGSPYLGRSYDPLKDDMDTLRVIKGGSFMCNDSYCAGYRPEARQSAVQGEAYFHVGFRVARDLN